MSRTFSFLLSISHEGKFYPCNTDQQASWRHGQSKRQLWCALSQGRATAMIVELKLEKTRLVLKSQRKSMRHLNRCQENELVPWKNKTMECLQGYPEDHKNWDVLYNKRPPNTREPHFLLYLLEAGRVAKPASQLVINETEPYLLASFSVTWVANLLRLLLWPAIQF